MLSFALPRPSFSKVSFTSLWQLLFSRVPPVVDGNCGEAPSAGDQMDERFRSVRGPPSPLISTAYLQKKKERATSNKGIDDDPCVTTIIWFPLRGMQFAPIRLRIAPLVHFCSPQFVLFIFTSAIYFAISWLFQLLLLL